MSPMNDTTVNINEIRKKLENSSGQKYWRSLDEVADTPEFQAFMQKEFPQHAAPLESSVDRRDFLKLLGASLALGGLTACARPPQPHEKIVPYVKAPEEIIPGRPLFFATAITQGGYALGLLAESHMGRPTKLEGNPDHPASLGATDATTQATVLSLYDPDRSQQVLQGGQPKSWADVAAVLADAPANNGAGLRILTETVTSPTLAKQLSDLLTQYPEAQWHQYDTYNSDNAYEGALMAFNEPVTTTYDFTKADVVVSLGADFLGTGPGKLRYSKDFSSRRRVRSAEDSMNRLYLFESSPSQTGSLADHRVALKPSQITALATQLASELGVSEEGATSNVDTHLLEAMIEDLNAHQGSSIIIAGDDQPAAVHALAHLMNARLNNVGTTVIYREAVAANPVNQTESLSELVNAMDAGDVSTLLMIGGNPVYSAPADLNFEAALAKVETSIHLSEYVDETSRSSSWHVPRTHFLEAWGDARAFDGTISITQPLISPFYGGKSDHEVLAALTGDAEATNYNIVRDYWRNRVDGSIDLFWQESVYRGTVANSASPSKNVTPANNIPAPDITESELELVVQLDPSIGDGRYANNGWLQELPNPFTKLTWDNAALISPTTAEANNLATDDLVTLTVDGRSVTAPVMILPGQAAGAITVHLGYGRSAAGRVGSTLGFDANVLRASSSMWHAPVSLQKAGGKHHLVTTQHHFSLEGTGERRHIIRHGTLSDLKAHPEHPHFVHPVAHPHSDLYPDYEYNSYAWGMVIDQNVCTSCNACVTACQAENNIPIVGKKQVSIGREMHWIRVDTYYSGELDDPTYYHQPMACQHCEKAPCEPVCPVGATVHDSEGLNVMVYNRCVGTRYCSNNCPYKVRRFNFLQYAELMRDVTELSLVQNPDVTVRSRGVMEKCTYCTQRIQQAYITSENENRKIQDGEVITACQAACPTEAIVFGDINNADAEVTKTKASVLNYALLEELNTVPRTSYLAKLSNPHPALAGETEAEVH